MFLAFADQAWSTRIYYHGSHPSENAQELISIRNVEHSQNRPFMRYLAVPVNQMVLTGAAVKIRTEDEGMVKMC